MSGQVTRAAAALASAAFLACATAQPPLTPTAEGATAAVDSDPWQGFNRSMFWVNDRVLDRFIYAPLAHGWIYITPLTVRTHIDQFFDNLNFPGYFVQPLLQGDPKQSGVALGRFAINTTVGVAGIFDPANHYLGLARRPEDMGQTFGVWGIPPGPYVVLPLIAPTSTLRDIAGLPIDWILNVGDSYFWPWFAPYGETMIRDINRRALFDADLTAAREAAFDWYSAARDAYLQRREDAIRNRNGLETEAPSDDLYQIDESGKSPD